MTCPLVFIDGLDLRGRQRTCPLIFQPKLSAWAEVTVNAQSTAALAVRMKRDENFMDAWYLVVLFIFFGWLLLVDLVVRLKGSKG